MKINESNLERIIRAVAGVVLLYVGFGGVLTGTLGVIVGLIGAVLVITGALGFCPIYALLKFSTASK